MAPSMKLLQPDAQSEQAKKMLPCLSRISVKCEDNKPGPEKNLRKRKVNIWRYFAFTSAGLTKRLWQIRLETSCEIPRRRFSGCSLNS